MTSDLYCVILRAREGQMMEWFEPRPMDREPRKWPGSFYEVRHSTW